MTDPAIAALAAREYTTRHATATRKVAAGALDPQAADALLRPWLALACRAGADRPEYADDLAEQRTRPGRWPEGVLRAAIADGISPRQPMVETLAAARDAAIARAEASGNPEHVDRARGLMRLARHFLAPPTQLRRPTAANDAEQSTGPTARTTETPAKEDLFA